MERTATWSNIGTDVLGKKSIHDVLKISDLDYTVEKRKLLTADGIEVTGRKATVRTDTNEVLGIVSDSYNICQNEEAFSFLDYVEDVEYVRSGTTHAGLVYVIGRLPEVNILGDSFQPYIIIQTGHTGGISLKACICPLRIVCQNQFNYAFKNTNNAISIRHSTNLESKLEEAKFLMKSVAAHMSQVTKEAEKYANTKVDSSQIAEIINTIFPITEDLSDNMTRNIEAKRVAFIEAYNSYDNSNFTGTAWGLFNAYSDFFTHQTPSRKTATSSDNMFAYVTLTPAMSKFIEIVNSKVMVR